MRYLTGLEAPEQILRGPLAGSWFENYVVAEVLKTLSVRPGGGRGLHFFRSTNGWEVDLIVEQGDGRSTLVEIKLNRSPTRSMAANLARFEENFPEVAVGRKVIACLVAGVHGFGQGVEAMGVRELTAWLGD